MNHGFTKLFSSLVTSTIWCETNPTRIVWITMLALADRNGEVGASIPGLARTANVSMAECEAAITAFLSPDEHSRTKEFEGRRIEVIDGGWRLINHAKYREAMRSMDRTEYLRVKQAERRARKKSASTKVNMSTTVNPAQPISEAEAEAEAEADKNTLLATPALRARNPLFDALCEVEGIPLNELGKSGARIGAALKEIKAMSPNVTPEEIRQRSENYISHFAAVLTASALAKWWGKCHAPAQPKQPAGDGTVPWQRRSDLIDHSKGF